MFDIISILIIMFFFRLQIYNFFSIYKVTGISLKN